MNTTLRLTIVFLGAAVGGLWLNTVYGASFDCAKAQTKVEKMICANKDLSDWDSLMAQSYQLDMLWKSQIEWVKRTQISWLKQRNKCQDVACLKESYRDRIYELWNPPGHEGKWIDDPYNPGIGQNSKLSRELLDRLNSFNWNSSSCGADVVLTYKGFSQPSWQKLDPNKYLILIYQLLVSGGSEHDLKYYPFTNKIRRPASIKEKTKRAEEFIRKGGELLVWHARIFDYYGSQSQPVPPGKQTIVELRYRYDPSGLAICRGKPVATSSGSTYVVASDLSGLDPNIGPAMASWLSSGVLLFNHGHLYLVSGETVYRLMNPNDITYGSPSFYCSFRYNEFKKEE